MTTIDTEALFASQEDRTVTGLLMPWGERSKLSVTGTEPVFFERGTLTVPADVDVVTANIGHDRYNPVGRAISIEDTERGLVASFKIAKTPEGDALLADVADKATAKFARLSAEVRGLIRDGSKAVTAVLTGAAFVTEGAFESAALFAVVGSEHSEDTYTDAEGRTWRLVRDSETTSEEDEDGTTTTTTTVVTESSTTNPEEEETVPNATVPETLNAGASTAPAPTTLAQVAGALANFARTGNKTALFDAIPEQDRSRGEDGMFALNDIKITTGGSVGSAFVQPQWIGELWAGRTYARKVIPLITSDVLNGFTVEGFRWTTKPAMSAWAGDKSNVPTNSPATQAYSATAQRYAGGHDIAREYRDFKNAQTDAFWASYFQAMTDSYAKLTDDATLAALVAGATAVTAGAVPTGVNAGLVSIVDGALSIIDVATPDFAIVAKDVYRGIALLRDVDKLAFLNTALGLEEGTLTSFRVVPHASLANGKVLVGAKAAAKSYELPGSPIQVEALDLIRGGIDEAVFGYHLPTVENAAALSLVSPAA